MREPGPVEVVHMTLRAGPHEPGGHHRLAVEAAAPVVQCPAMHEAPRALAVGVAVAVLDHEPFREAPRADSPARRPRILGLGRRCVHPGGRQAGDGPEQTGEPLVDDLVQVAGGPRLKPGDDGGVLGQIEERARPVGGDHLALAQLPVASAHGLPPPDPRTRSAIAALRMRTRLIARRSCVTPPGV